jgi:hypothetical protein
MSIEKKSDAEAKKKQRIGLKEKGCFVTETAVGGV